MDILIPNVNTLTETWCVYEHWMIMKPGEIAELIFVSPCRLIEVFEMREARNNSEWCNLAAVSPPVVVRIIEITNDKTVAFNKAREHVRSLPTMPRCNLHGFNLHGANRVLIASDGREFANQHDAAKAIGCSQSAISQHMNGRIDSVKGVKFAYKTRKS